MRYPSGLPHGLPEDDDGGDVRAWLARVVVEAETTPLGQTAPCKNPECAGPVDYLPGLSGAQALYCSRRCSNRASELRLRARQQLDVIETLLERTKGKHNVPRETLTARANHLRWWLRWLGSEDLS